MLQQHETLTTGACSVHRQRASNPREIVTRLFEKSPGAMPEALFDQFERRLAKDADGRRAVNWYFFWNMYRYLSVPKNRPVTEDRRRSETSQLVARIVDVVLLDLVLPNGKVLRDATGAECAAAGGWFAKIAKKVGPRRIVGKVLTEKQLRAIHA